MTKILKYLLLFTALLSLTWPAHSQKEGAIWYFGYNAGLDFTRHYPKPITDGQIHTREGVATISSPEGDLLFYTDGTTVWNKNHQVMDNGTGLAGNITSTQSSIIVPTPNKQFEYYIFTVDVVDDNGVPGKGLNYSLVNMIENNRLGRVFPKNQNLLPSCVEKITAVRHDNGIDYWIIAHGWNNNIFHVYKLTTSGVSPASGEYAQQALGSVHQNTDPQDDSFVLVTVLPSLVMLMSGPTGLKSQVASTSRSPASEESSFLADLSAVKRMSSPGSRAL